MKRVSPFVGNSSVWPTAWWVVALAVTLTAVFILMSATGVSTTTLTWPAEPDQAHQAYLMWPAPGDVPFYTLTWPVPGDVVAATPMWPVAADVVAVDLPVYFCRCDCLVPATRIVGPADVCCETALERLLAGPTAMELYAGYRSALPWDAHLVSATVISGIATVSFDADPGASDAATVSLEGLGQIVYTATEIPDVEAVRVIWNGEPLPLPGGDLLTGKGITRQEWDAAALG